MKAFNFKTQKADNIIAIKKNYKTNSNNPDTIRDYHKVLEDSQIAIDNIEECLNDRNTLRQIYVGFNKGDTSFLDNVIGLDSRGLNDSHYRDFLTLDTANVVGVRISDHYETEKTALDKSNNKVQYLFQVVLIPNPPNKEQTDSIKTTTAVGNVKILTKGYIDTERNWGNLQQLLKTLQDYLTCSDYTYDENLANGNNIQDNQQQNNISEKRTICLTESKLRNIIRESVRNIMETDFRYVDNLGDYISKNGLQMKPASKFQRVNAQSGKSFINQYGKGQGMDKRQIGRMVRKGGAPLTTVAGDGTQETNNMVTRNHTVLNNVGNANNRWAAETPTFNRKYEQDPSAQGVYKPKGGPMNAAQINEPISFTAPWGEKMNIDKGGYILQDPNNPNDAYGISGKDFDSTYRFNEGKNNRLISKNMKQTIRLTESQLHRIIKNCVNEAINEGLFGTPLFGNDKKYGEKWYDPNTWLTKQQKNQQDEYEKKWAPIRKERERQRQQVEKEREEKRQEERRQKEWREHRYDKYGGYEGYLAYCKAEYEKRHPYACHAGETYSGIGHSAYDNMGR